MRKEKKEKKGIPPFFPHPRNNFLKKNSLPLPIPHNKTPLFCIKTPHLKKTL
jgi:hypothetical protein